MKVKVALSLLALFSMGAVGHALAADGEFFVGIEGTFVKPSNLGTGYVLISPEDSGYPTGEIRSVELSESFAPKISFGQKRASGSGWMFSYWSYDDDGDDRAASSEAGSLGDILYHADMAWGFFDGSATADLAVEATTADLVYFRRIGEGEDFHLEWILGFRYASYEQALDVSYVYGDADYVWHVQLGNDTDGFGLLTGLQGSVALGGALRLEGGVSYAILQGSTTATDFQYEEGYIEDPQADLRRDEDRGIGMIELEASLVWQISDHVDVRAGYVASQWHDVLTSDLFPDDVHESFVLNDVKDVSWNGFNLGMKYTF
jgi:hypothetical protein